jgi:uncharacterized membrane protein
MTSRRLFRLGSVSDHGSIGIMELVTTALLWFSAVGCGLIGGLYFAFSTFIMQALGRIPDPAGIAAMQSINRVILQSLFMPIFFGTTVTSLALAVIALFRMGEPGSIAMLVGGILYVATMFVVTMLFNVPLNNALDRVSGDAASAIWVRYQKDWTVWNHIRTIGSLAASALFIYALVAQAAGN